MDKDLRAGLIVIAAQLAPSNERCVLPESLLAQLRDAVSAAGGWGNALDITLARQAHRMEALVENNFASWKRIRSELKCFVPQTICPQSQCFEGGFYGIPFITRRALTVGSWRSSNWTDGDAPVWGRPLPDEIRRTVGKQLGVTVHRMLVMPDVDAMAVPAAFSLQYEVAREILDVLISEQEAVVQLHPGVAAWCSPKRFAGCMFIVELPDVNGQIECNQSFALWRKVLEFRKLLTGIYDVPCSVCRGCTTSSMAGLKSDADTNNRSTRRVLSAFRSAPVLCTPQRWRIHRWGMYDDQPRILDVELLTSERSRGVIERHFIVQLGAMRELLAEIHERAALSGAQIEIAADV